MTGFIKAGRNIMPPSMKLLGINKKPEVAIADAFKPQMPEAPPPAPTIDDAAQQRDSVDRLRKRRGVLANIFAGGGSSTLGG